MQCSQPERGRSVIERPGAAAFAVQCCDPVGVVPIALSHRVQVEIRPAVREQQGRVIVEHRDEAGMLAVDKVVEIGEESLFIGGFGEFFPGVVVTDTPSDGAETRDHLIEQGCAGQPAVHRGQFVHELRPGAGQVGGRRDVPESGQQHVLPAFQDVPQRRGHQLAGVDDNGVRGRAGCGRHRRGGPGCADRQEPVQAAKRRRQPRRGVMSGDGAARYQFG